MKRNKAALIVSAVILCICKYLYFPFPNNEMLELRPTFTFMSFPIHNQDGYIMLGIIGSVLFIIAMILLFIGIKEYHFRAIVIVMVIYTLLPKLLITTYQETLASGIMAISYDGKGTCNFENVNDDLLDGEANLDLHNRSNEDVSFELEFLDSSLNEDGVRMESLLNLAGPYKFTIEANNIRSIQLNEMIDVSDVPHIWSGTSKNVHIILTDGETKRIF